MKKTIISSAICFMLGAITCGIILFSFQKKQTNKLENGIVVEALEGKPGTITIEKVKNYPKRIELTVHAKDKGTIRTVIKKVDFCPKIYKNSLSLIVGGGIINNLPIISYGAEYRRQVLPRFHILTGIDVDFINGNRYYGTKAKIGVGFNFGGSK